MDRGQHRKEIQTVVGYKKHRHIKKNRDREIDRRNHSKKIVKETGYKKHRK